MYPSNSDYNTIISNLATFINCDEIKDYKPIKINNRFISYSWGFSKVYPLQNLKGEKIAIRFWTKHIKESFTRYEEIEKYLNKTNLPYFVKFKYFQDGLLWNNKSIPFITMEWVKGVTLNNFLDEHIENTTLIKVLAEKFSQLVVDLHKNEISHGDLQEGNILIVEKNNDIEIKLIDYDSLYVPSLSNYPIEIDGIEAYQHPNRKNVKKMNKKIDYFSELVIYLSLLAYVENSNLWIKETDKQLLFTKDDYIDINNSEIFKELQSDGYSENIKKLSDKLKKFCLEEDINNLEPLENIILHLFHEQLQIQKKLENIKKISRKNRKI